MGPDIIRGQVTKYLRDLVEGDKLLLHKPQGVGMVTANRKVFPAQNLYAISYTVLEGPEKGVTILGEIGNGADTVVLVVEAESLVDIRDRFKHRKVLDYEL